MGTPLRSDNVLAKNAAQQARTLRELYRLGQTLSSFEATFQLFRRELKRVSSEDQLLDLEHSWHLVRQNVDQLGARAELSGVLGPLEKLDGVIAKGELTDARQIAERVWSELKSSRSKNAIEFSRQLDSVVEETGHLSAQLPVH